MRRFLPLLVKLAVSVAIIAALAWNIDLSGTLSRARDGNPGWIAAAAFFILAQMIIATWRWQVVIAAIGGRLGFGPAWRLVYIGQFFNLILPSTVGGDAIRGWMIWKSGMTAMNAASSVLLDRLVAVLGLVLTIAATQWLLPPMEQADMVALVVAGIVAGAIGGTGTLMLLDRLPPQLQEMRLFSALARLSRDVRAVLLSWPYNMGAVGMGVLGQINLSMALYALAQAFGIPLTVIDCLVLWPLVVLVTLLPVSISGWGLREGAMVVALGLAGVSGESSMLLSVSIGLLATVMALPGGLLWLSVRQPQPASQTTIP
jgi:glycosyltransferase 2 family protein